MAAFAYGRSSSKAAGICGSPHMGTRHFHNYTPRPFAINLTHVSPFASYFKAEKILGAGLG